MANQINETTALENVFSLFTTNYSGLYREWMKNPVEYNGKVYATNGQCLVRCDVDRVDFEYSTGGTGTINVESSMPKPNVSLIIDFDGIDWKSLMTEDETIVNAKEDVECGYCKGDGTYYGEIWHKGKSYDVEYECPVCEGTGIEKREIAAKTGNKTFNDSDVIKFKFANFYAKNFYKLKQVSDLVNEPIELVSCNGKYSAHLFKIGFLDVLIMPCQVDFYDSYNTVLSIDY